MIETLPDVGVGTHRYQMLTAFKSGKKLTPDDAVQETSMSILSCYWKRVSELAEMGCLTVVGSAVGSLRGGTQKVYKITTLGRQTLKALG